jgi:multiple sugar transport system substrate-binding protein
MKFEFVPWPNFADRMLNELNSGGKLCDLLIGDSQWIGGSAENGHYVKLNDFFDKPRHQAMDDFAPATVYAYSTWPKGTPNYWALPAMGDAVGWTYRKDWFERPRSRPSSRRSTAATWRAEDLDELKEIAEFFQGREIDGKTVYGASIFTERGSEGITMGATGALYPFGFKYENPRPYDMEGFVNSPRRSRGSSSTRSSTSAARRRATPNAYMERGARRLQVGPGGDADELVRLLPRPLQGPERRRRQDRLLRQPGQNVKASTARRAGHLGRRLLRQAGRGAGIHQVVRPARGAGEVVVARRLFLPQRGAERPELRRPAPFAQTSSTMAIVQDFWQEPAYASLLLAMQKRCTTTSSPTGHRAGALDG